MRSKGIELFLEFLVFGIALGMTEDLIVLLLVGGHELITLKSIYTVLLIAVPFALVTELVADKVNFSKLLGISVKTEIFLEFLVSGIILGITEDLIAITLIAGKPISLKIILLILILSVTFAGISELIVDRVNMMHHRKKRKAIKRGKETKAE